MPSMRPKVQVYSHCPDGSSFHRLLEPARVLGTEVVEYPELVVADTVVTNRPIDPDVHDWVIKWVKEGRRVIVDNDDSFDHLDPDHGIYGRYDTGLLHDACEAATLNTVSTPALGKLYGKGKVEVLPNCVPASYLDIDPKGRRAPKTWVGWSGSISAHPHDLEAVGSGLDKAMAHTDSAAVYLGPQSDQYEVTRQLGLTEVTPLGFVSIIGFPFVVTEFDIAIVPLARTGFNDMKSWIKGLVAAATGVAVVASPTADYRRMASMGGCLTAKSSTDWYECVSELIKNPALRKLQAERGRDMAKNWTYENRAKYWREVWYA